ncbi:hypothetical protein M3Y97_00667100 [Aphelenchoides bicaudatus]|nr:hypothetical protein M3Y97_00667100 [Aphelenchoides bicaudatus]
MVRFVAFLCMALVVGVLSEEHQQSRLQFDTVDSFQRNSPALNQLFSQATGQSWKYGQLAAKGIRSELNAKAVNLLREVRKIATKHTLNVRSEYQKLNKNTQQNLQGAVPVVKAVVSNYATFKPIVEIVRKQIPSGFISTLTN